MGLPRRRQWPMPEKYTIVMDSGLDVGCGCGVSPGPWRMWELTWGQLKSICDSTLMIEWRVRPADVQARSVRKLLDNRYHLGTLTEAEEWYAGQTVIKHNSIWGESPKRTGDHRLGVTLRAPQTKPPGSSTMHRSRRHTHWPRVRERSK